MIIRALARTFAFVFSVIAVGAVGASYLTPSDLSWPAPSERNGYRTVAVERGHIAETVLATGTLQAVATVLVGTQVSGQISEIFADFNTEVAKGDVIARIDPLSFQNAVDEARAEVDIAQAVLAKMQVALGEAEDEERRKQKLVSAGAGSAVELSKAVASRRLAAAEVQNATSAIEKSQAVLKKSLLDLERSQIRSPVNGIVIQRNVEQGQTVAAELQAPTLFVIAQDLRDMQVNLSIDEADIGRLSVGQPVAFTVDTFPDREFSGKVIQIRKYPVVTENVTTYVVIASAPNSDLVLIPGLTANARVVLEDKKDVLKVPRAALRFRPKDARFFGPAVWVLGPSGPIEKPVRVGLSDSTHTEIEGDLREGESVVIGDDAQSDLTLTRWAISGLK